MNWETFWRVIYSPPAIITIIVVTIIIGHILRPIRAVRGGGKGKKAEIDVIPRIELIMTMILGVLLLEVFLFAALKDGSYISNPMEILKIFVLACFASMVIYFIGKKWLG